MHDLALNPGGLPAEHLPIYRLEAELLKLPQVDTPVEHDFCDGIYARTMRIPAGTVMTGAVHRRECFFLVRSGLLAVTTREEPKLLKAGDMFVTPAGTKRAAMAINDVVVTTFHANPNKIKEPDALWDEFVIPAPAMVLAGGRA